MIAEAVERALKRGCLKTKENFKPLPTIEDRGVWSHLDKAAQTYYEAMMPEMLACTPAPIPASLLMRFCQDGDRKTHGDAYFGRRVQLYKLCLCELIEDEGRFLPNIVDHIWAICEETSWVIPAHIHQNPLCYGKDLPLPTLETANSYIDLFSAETASILCWVKYLLSSRLRAYPAVTQRIEYEIRRRVLDHFERIPTMHWSGCVEGAHLNNWTPWIYSNLIAVALLSEEDEDRRQGWLRLTAKGLDAFLATYAPDGGCDEGPAYFNKAGACLLDALELIDLSSDGQAAVWQDALIQNIASYIQYAHIDGEYYINFADAGCRVRADAALLKRCAAFMKNESLAAFAEQLSAAGYAAAPYQAGYDSVYRRVKNTLECKAPAAAEKPPLRPLSHYWSGIQAAIARVGVRPEGLCFAAKGGHNAESHNHNDIGNFIVYASGEPFIVDAGVETYSRKTFSKERYEIWTMQSGYHNTVIIGGKNQKPGREYAARDARFEDTGDIASFRCDMLAAYGFQDLPKSARYERNLTLNRTKGSLTLVDEFDFPKEMDLLLPLLTAVKPEITSGRVLLRGARTSLSIAFDPSYALRFEEIVLTDSSLRANWQRDSLYRLLIDPGKKLRSGTVTLTFREEKI